MNLDFIDQKSITSEQKFQLMLLNRIEKLELDYDHHFKKRYVCEESNNLYKKIQDINKKYKVFTFSDKKASILSKIPINLHNKILDCELEYLYEYCFEKIDKYPYPSEIDKQNFLNTINCLFIYTGGFKDPDVTKWLEQIFESYLGYKL